jgi:ATP-dependent exoDNAse (exonuclease V) alpha subunit
MHKHPNSPVILQVGGMIIDCGAVDHAAAMGPEQTGLDQWVVSVSLRASGKITRLSMVDKESAFILLSRIKRGMIAWYTGDYELLESYGDDDEEDEDEGELPPLDDDDGPPNDGNPDDLTGSTA